MARPNLETYDPRKALAVAENVIEHFDQQLRTFIETLVRQEKQKHGFVDKNMILEMIKSLLQSYFHSMHDYPGLTLTLAFDGQEVGFSLIPYPSKAKSDIGQAVEVEGILFDDTDQTHVFGVTDVMAANKFLDLMYERSNDDMSNFKLGVKLMA